MALFLRNTRGGSLPPGFLPRSGSGSAKQAQGSFQGGGGRQGRTRRGPGKELSIFIRFLLMANIYLFFRGGHPTVSSHITAVSLSPPGGGGLVPIPTSHPFPPLVGWWGWDLSDDIWERVHPLPPHTPVAPPRRAYDRSPPLRSSTRSPSTSSARRSRTPRP